MNKLKKILRKIDRKICGKPTIVELVDDYWPYPPHNPENNKDMTNYELRDEIAALHNAEMNKLRIIMNSITKAQWGNNRKFWYTLILNTILTGVGIILSISGIILTIIYGMIK